MPDDLYNGMIAHQQRLEENARRQGLPPGVVMDNAMVKPWEQWMMDQQNQQRAPASVERPPFLGVPGPELMPYKDVTGMPALKDLYGGMTPGQALGGELSFQGTRGDQAQQFPNLSANPNFNFGAAIAPLASPQTNPAMGPGASLTQPQPAGQLTQLGLGQSRLV
jgi:hypothetical protein